MAQWWEAAPLVAAPGAPAAQGNWWEAAPLVEAAAPAPPAPPVEERSWMDTLSSALGAADNVGAQALRGARKGIAGVAGLPVDLVNASPMLGNLLPGEQNIGPISEKPFMGGQFIDEALGGFGALGEPPAPANIVERGARRIGQELGGAAVPIGGALAAGARLGVHGARELPGIARMFVEPAAVNPGRFIGKETSVATAAGMGAAGANEAFPDSPTADMLGAIGGAGAYGLAGMTGRGAKTTFDALRQNENYTDVVVREAVADRLINAAGLPAGPSGVDTSDIVAAISGGPRVADVIPGFQESLADRTGNAGLAALEYGRQSGPNSGEFVGRRSANTDAVDAVMAALEPEATPGVFRSALADQRNTRISDANRAAREAEEAAIAAIMPLRPASTPAARGETVRTALEEARDAARARTDDAYEAANLNTREVDPVALSDTLATTLAGMTQIERALVPDPLLDRVRALGASVNETTPPPPIVLKEATDLRSQLQHIQRAALGDKTETGGRNKARVLQRLVSAVDGYIEGNLDPTEVEALAAARGAKFEEAEAFTRRGDPVAAALARNEGGQPRMGDDRVAGTFVPSQNMDRLFAQADTPAVRTAIREELLSRADTASPESVAAFMDAHAEQLDRFPGLRGELEAARTARGVERVAKAAETGIVKQLGEKGSSAVARYLSYGDEQADSAINTVLANKKPGAAADELLTFVNDDPQAAEGARAALWRVLRRKGQSTDNAQRSMGGNRAWRGDWLKSWLDKPATAAVVERFYRDQPEQLQRIRQIADVLSNVDLRQRGKAVGTSGTGQSVNQVLTPETLQSRGYAYMRGQISGTYLATSIMAVMARRAVRKAQDKAIETLTDKALLDPEIAAQLLKENNPANRAAMARKAKAWFGNEAATIINMLNEDEDEDPVVRAARGG